MTTLEATYTSSFARPRQTRTIWAVPRKTSYVAAKLARNRSLDHALRELNGVRGASKASIDQMRGHLQRVLTDGMAFASISSDGDGGTLAQWRAGRSYIAFEVSPHGQDSLVYADTNGNLIVNTVGPEACDTGRLHVALQRFTADLNARKPDWRAVRESHGRR